MLLLLIAWIALTAACAPVGAAVVSWTASHCVFDRVGDRLVLSLWLGVLLLGSALLAASLVFALSPLVGAIVGFGAAAAALSSRAVRAELSAYRARLDRRLLAALVAFAIGLAALTAQPVVWFDTGNYHASAIRWLSEFGAVQGVALTQYRLGFGSSWFALAAPFSPAGLRDQALGVMGGFALLLLCLQVAICASRALARRARSADWLLIAGAAVLLAALVALQRANVSASPDLPVAILGLLVGWAIFSIADSRRHELPVLPATPGPEAIPVLLALGAMAIKPQAAPLAAVAALFYLSREDDRLRRALWAIGLGSVLLAPWVAYELVTTGCPLYPLPLCTDAEWSVGSDTARRATETIQTTTRWHDQQPGSGLGWVGPWLRSDLGAGPAAFGVLSVMALSGGILAGSRARLASGVGRAAGWMAIAGAAGLFLFLIRAEEIFMVLLATVSLIPLRVRRPGSGWLLALGLAGTALTLYAAPDPRFAFGYMAVLFGRLAVLHGPRLWGWLRPRLDLPARALEPGLATVLLVFAAAGLLGPFIRPTTPLSEGPGVLAPAATTAPVVVFPVNGIAYRLPADQAQPAGSAPNGATAGLCWAAELPCTVPGDNDPAATLQDPDEGLAAGFNRTGRGN